MKILDITSSGLDLSTRLCHEYGKTQGCYSMQMSNADYHADRRYLSSTGCKTLLRSPAHFQHYLHGPRKEATAAQRLGSALHCAVLEPGRYLTDYRVFDGDRRGSTWTAFQAAHAGCEILTRTESQLVGGMRDALMECQAFPLAALVRNGDSEKSIFFVDEETGVPCKIRCDSVSPHLILDLKTTDDARGESFSRQLMKLQYDLQAAMYQEGCRQFYGNRLPFYFVVVEIQPPHGVMVHRAGETVLECGFRKWRKALSVYTECRETEIWPGYAEAAHVLELPHWSLWNC